MPKTRSYKRAAERHSPLVAARRKEPTARGYIIQPKSIANWAGLTGSPSCHDAAVQIVRREWDRRSAPDPLPGLCKPPTRRRPTTVFVFCREVRGTAPSAPARPDARAAAAASARVCVCTPPPPHPQRPGERRGRYPRHPRVCPATGLQPTTPRTRPGPPSRASVPRDAASRSRIPRPCTHPYRHGRPIPLRRPHDATSSSPHVPPPVLPPASLPNGVARHARGRRHRGDGAR